VLKSDIPALFSVSLFLVGGFGLYEVWLERRHSTPPLIKMSIFRRHDWLVLYVVLMALSAYTAISVCHICERERC